MKLENLSDLPIALTDIETTGDVPGVHEILEIGVIIFDQKTQKIIDTLDIKVKPKHLETALPIAMERNSFNEAEWANAVSLEEAMGIFSEKTKGCIFSAFNNTFDWGFIAEAFQTTGVLNQMDYHRLDVLTMAWQKGMKEKASWSLKNTCKWLELEPEPDPHSAFNGAKTVFEVFKKLNPIN